MDTLDPAAEYLRIAEHYRQMKDEELLALVPQSDELTPFAQQALTSEIRHRGLKIETSAEKAPAVALPSNRSRFDRESPKFREPSAQQSVETRHDPSPGAGAPDRDSYEEDPYEEERELFTLCIVWSLRDALKVQWLLDRAGIPFFMGPEKATGVDKVTSNFAAGMQVGWPLAYQAMKDRYFPEDVPPSEKPTEPKDVKNLVVRCPQCQSTEVVFNGLGAAAGVPGDSSSRKFRWTCDACGNQWEDEGVGKEE